MAKSIEDLKKLRDELVRRRRTEVEEIASATDDERIAATVQVHLAIEALKAVIENTQSEAKPFDPNRIVRTP